MIADSMLLGFRRVLTLLLGIVSMTNAACAQRGPAIWSGSSAGYEVRWTASEIDVRRGDRRVFSAREWANEGLTHFIAANRSAGETRAPDCNYRRSIRIVSMVGSMLSLEDSSEISCRQEAHPGGMTRLITVDLSKSGSLAHAGGDALGQVDTAKPERAVLLTSLFPAADVLAALAAASPVRGVLRAVNAKPATLPALLSAIADARGEGDACFIVPSDLLSAFAFDRMDGQRVIVRLGLPGDGPCRTNLTTSDLSFAIPAALAPALQNAASGAAGFLEARGEQIAAGRVTVITLHSGRGLGR